METKREFSIEELVEIGRVASLETFCLVAADEHPLYMLEKAGLLSDPLAYKALDRRKRQELDNYFERWGLTDSWSAYRMAVEYDWQHIPLDEFERRWCWVL